MKCVLNKRLLHFLTVSGSPCSMAQSTWQCHPPHDKPSYFCLLRPYYQAWGNYCTTKALLHRGHWSVLCQHSPRACFFPSIFPYSFGILVKDHTALLPTVLLPPPRCRSCPSFGHHLPSLCPLFCRNKYFFWISISAEYLLTYRPAQCFVIYHMYCCCWKKQSQKSTPCRHKGNFMMIIVLECIIMRVCNVECVI